MPCKSVCWHKRGAESVNLIAKKPLSRDLKMVFLQCFNYDDLMTKLGRLPDILKYLPGNAGFSLK
jgi:hypothetical protein